VPSRSKKTAGDPDMCEAMGFHQHRPSGR